MPTAVMMMIQGRGTRQDKRARGVKKQKEKKITGFLFFPSNHESPALLNSVLRLLAIHVCSSIGVERGIAA